MANHLSSAVSPYLLRHAENLVGWYPWGEEALHRARMAATTLLRLGGLTCDSHYVNIGYRALAQTEPMMSQYPLRFGQWLQAASYVLSQPKEIAIVGKPYPMVV